MPHKKPISETIATAQHWMHRIERLDSDNLLPHRLPVDMQIFLARLFAMRDGGALYQGELKASRELMQRWVERLLHKQNPGRVAVFRKNSAVMLPKMADELEHWLHLDLVSRLIGYPLTRSRISILFKSAFDELNAEV